MNLIRLGACAAVAALLGGCNMVVTDQPLFAKVDGAGAPRFRTGIWNGAPPGCAFDETKPQKDWPKCANAQPAIPDPPPWLAVPGDPGILQISTPPDPKQPINVTLYVGYRPTRTDSVGRVVEIALWPVQCGPPPGAGDTTGLTQHMLPGLTPRKDFAACATASKEALRHAARASEAWAPAEAMKTHWVRDPIAGDLTGPVETKF